MEQPGDGCLLRIFIGESDKHGGLPLYEWIVMCARKNGLAGATVLRGMMGFGPNSRVFTTNILRLSEDLPVVVEIVDLFSKLKPFVAQIDPAIRDGLITMEKVQVRVYRSKGCE